MSSNNPPPSVDIFDRHFPKSMPAPRTRTLRHEPTVGVKDVMVACLQAILEMERSDIFASCLTCNHWERQAELCRKANPPARPPAHVIVNACAAYQDYDQIPF